MLNILDIILFVTGALIGALSGYIFGTRKNRETQSRADAAGQIESELRKQLQQTAGDLTATREKLSAAEQARVAAQAREQATIERLTEQQRQQSQSLAELRAAHEKALGELRESFAALSAKALRESQPEFLRLANETFAKLARTAEGDLKARQEAIAGIVAPLKDQLAVYQQRLQAAEQSQTQTLGAVRQQLESLQTHSQSLADETNKLRRVLSSSQARGRWGEETLRRVVESAGMSAHCDFSEQTQVGESKPDLLVKLPGDRIIIVDAKVPDLDFLDALHTADDTSRREKLVAHAAKLKATIQALAKRDYPRQFPNALPKVVLFVPAESLLSAALEGDPNLIVSAAELSILLATPSSLIALLYAVSMSWQQQAQTENAREIARAGLELYERVGKFFEHFATVLIGLEKAASGYNDAIASFERRVRPSGDRLLKLAGSAPEAALPELKPVETSLRALPESDSKNTQA